MNSIEWLIDAMENPNKNINWEDTKQQAKLLHKQEIIDAIINYYIQKADRDINFKSLEHGIKIENVDMAKMIFGEDEASGEAELPQQEISINKLKNICQSVIDNTPSDATEKEIGYTKAMEHIIKIIDGQPHKYPHPKISNEEMKKEHPYLVKHKVFI
jgi:hypothetical protein